MERQTTQNEAVGDGEYSREVEMEMQGDNTEASDDFNMKKWRCWTLRAFTE